MTDALRILVISTMRDEGPNILHWLAHCRAAGVTDFLIFTNDCSDGTDALLDLLDAAGIVTHLRNSVPPGKSPQWSALREAQDHPLLARADWVAALDCDEYINLRSPLNSLQDLVGQVDADAIALPWRLFGHNGHASRPEAPPTRAFTRAIPPDALYPALSRFVKTLYRRGGPFRKPGVHRPRQTPGARPRWVDGSGHPLPDSFATNPDQIMLWGAPIASDLVQLNHYSVRSAQDFLAKARRGLPNHTDKPVDLTYWVERNFNTIEDDSILRMTPRTDANLVTLRKLPGIAPAERASLDWHAEAFRLALTHPAWVKLYGRLLLAASSQVPQPDAARMLSRLYQKAARHPGD